AVAEAALGRVNAALAADVEIAPLLDGAPAIRGVTNITDDRYAVRVAVATTPTNRETVRRAWRRMLLVAFAAGELIEPQP
ncbi:MAG TPA: hypothetical protein PLV68_19700, partial [Ilumatobacteraceae bacterium]|nr:hypothetical protein [Ilumatobacteraceae bacterium]